MKPGKKYLLYLSIGFAIIWLSACTLSKNTSEIRVDRGYLAFVDQSDNGYVVRGQRSLVKYDFRNHPAERYDFDLTIDESGLSTDLRIFAFNTDFQKFYILDKYLNLITEYEFNEYFDFLVRHPVLANGQSIWLYNQTENKIQEYSAQLRFLTETRNLDWEVPGIRVDQLFFHRNEVYLVDQSKGVFIFDFAGRLRQRIPLPNVSRSVQIDRSMTRIYTYFDNQWHVIDTEDTIPGFTPLQLPDKIASENPETLIFQNGKVYHWNSSRQQVDIYPNQSLIGD